MSADIKPAAEKVIASARNYLTTARLVECESKENEGVVSFDTLMHHSMAEGELEDALKALDKAKEGK